MPFNCEKYDTEVNENMIDMSMRERVMYREKEEEERERKRVKHFNI